MGYQPTSVESDGIPPPALWSEYGLSTVFPYLDPNTCVADYALKLITESEEVAPGEIGEQINQYDMRSERVHLFFQFCEDVNYQLVQAPGNEDVVAMAPSDRLKYSYSVVKDVGDKMLSNIYKNADYNQQISCYSFKRKLDIAVRTTRGLLLQEMHYHFQEAQNALFAGLI